MRFVSATFRKTRTSERTREALWRSRLEQEARIQAAPYVRPYEQGGLRPLLRGLLKVTGLWRRGVRNAASPILTHHEFSFEHLPPALEGFRVLHLSDLHFNGQPTFAEAVARTIAPVEADLCVFTGDYPLYNRAERVWVYEGLDAILGAVHARHGVIAILGNNDASVFVEPFRQRHIRLLVNEALALRIGDADLWVAGVDDPRDFRCDSIAEAMRGVPSEAFTILLAHSPEIIPEAAQHHIDLYLCGHTHGGQIRLPLLGAPFLNTRSPRQYGRGAWRFGGMQGYTSSGIGATAVPVRFNCPPEATLITLRGKGRQRVEPDVLNKHGLVRQDRGTDIKRY